MWYALAVAVGLTLVMLLIFGAACSLSRLKWRILLGASHPRNPHRADQACCCAPIGTSTPPDGLPDDWLQGGLQAGLQGVPPLNDAAGSGGGFSERCGSSGLRDANGTEHPEVPYVTFAPPSIPGVEYSG